MSALALWIMKICSIWPNTSNAMESLAKLLAPFTLHIAEELWASLGYDEAVVASA